MKKSVLDGKQWILEVLLRAGIDRIINGKIYKDQRPAESKAEDIVINSLTMTNDFLQNGIFNVNCYVSKITIKNGGIDQDVKNYERLKTISDKVYEALNNVWEEEFNLDVVYHQDFEEGDYNYMNFRVELNAYPQTNN